MRYTNPSLRLRLFDVKCPRKIKTYMYNGILLGTTHIILRGVISNDLNELAKHSIRWSIARPLYDSSLRFCVSQGKSFPSSRPGSACPVIVFQVLLFKLANFLGTIQENRGSFFWTQHVDCRVYLRLTVDCTTFAPYHCLILYIRIKCHPINPRWWTWCIGWPKIEI